MKPKYAILWSTDGGVASGALEPTTGGFELRGRDGRYPVRFCDVLQASIGRGAAARLRGLPVLAIGLRGGQLLRVASLEGTAVLHELAAWIERSGVAVGAA
jgi:hypothetical protein